MSNYEEGPERPIHTEGFSQAYISDFTGKEGLFGGKVRGCRASRLQAQHQCNVVCKRPPAQFEKIIASLGTGEKN